MTSAPDKAALVALAECHEREAFSASQHYSHPLYVERAYRSFAVAAALRGHAEQSA